MPPQSFDHAILTYGAFTPDAAIIAELEARLVRYVQVDTTSDEASSTIPSTPGQLVLSRLLAEELNEIGAANGTLSENGFVFATIPATVETTAPVVAFLAHVDTVAGIAGSSASWGWATRSPAVGSGPNSSAPMRRNMKEAPQSAARRMNSSATDAGMAESMGEAAAVARDGACAGGEAPATAVLSKASALSRSLSSRAGDCGAARSRLAAASVAADASARPGASGCGRRPSTARKAARVSGLPGTAPCLGGVFSACSRLPLVLRFRSRLCRALVGRSRRKPLCRLRYDLGRQLRR